VRTTPQTDTSLKPQADYYIEGYTTLLITLCMSVTGTMMFKVLPLVVGAAAESFHLQPHQLGLFASSDLAGITLASLLAPLWVRRVDWRRAGLAALLVVVVGNVLSATLDSLPTLLTVRFLTGIGEGSATGLALVILGDTRKPDRSFALSVGAPILVGLLGFQLLPPVVRQWGYSGLILTFAGIAAGIAVLTQWLPARGRPHAPLRAVGQSDVRAVFIALAATLVYHTAQGAIWAFIERMGKQAGLDAAFVSNTLGIAVVCGFFGAMANVALGVRYGRVAPFALAAAAQCVALWLLGDHVGSAAFTVATCLFQFFWLFAIPYQLGAIAQADTSGRFFVLALAFQAGGVTLGPLIAGLLIGDGGFLSVRLLAAACMAISVVMLASVGRMRK